VIGVASGRQRSSATALVVAAAAMTALEPRIVDDVSFQLSFAATLGLTTLASPLAERLQSLANRSATLAWFPLTRPTIALFAVTVAAVLFTLPITAATFGQVSPAAPLANLLVVPAFLAVAFTAGLAALVTLVAPDLAPLGAWIAWPAAEYMIETVRLFAKVPGASLTVGGLGRWHAFAFYAALLAGTWWLASRPVAVIEPPPRPPGVRRRALVPAAGVALLVALAGVFAILALSRPERGTLSVTFLDVGQGDAILIEGPRGHRVLVDGGPGSLPITRALSRNLPFDSRRIDLVVLTHPQADHLAGLLTVAGSYDVQAVLDTALPADSAMYEAWQADVRDSGATMAVADRGQTVDLGDGAVLQVIGPDRNDPLLPALEPNSASTVLRLTMGEASFLLTGDLDDEGEQALIRSGTDLQASVLKVGHHGSRTSTTPAFVARVDAAIDVISVGPNSFGHPTDEVLDRLDGDLVLRTDEHGDVTVSTDGERIWVER
jgi:competence protein ComEC